MSLACKDCKKRYLGCHDRCSLYKDYKESLERVKASDIDYNDYLSKATHRMSRYTYKGGQV